MSLDIEKELKALRQNLMACFRETHPTRQFQAAITLAMVSLHLIAARAQENQNVEERRKLTNVFIRRSQAIRRAIQMLRRQSRQDSKHPDSKEQRAMS